ncbi:MAG: phosphopentomutase [Firmicutes bacterium]|nr:phosphopentomutase [Bacillota bacterium]
MSRVVLLVLDGVGIGELPDAAGYGDEGSNTIINTARSFGGLNLPNLRLMGLGNIASELVGSQIPGTAPVQSPRASYGRMAERSPGKDTVTGHWELCGVILDRPFPLYPHGFPPEVIEPFERAIGRKVLGNKAASGTEIIKELGEEHMATGRPIIYTSADSVFQIACHESIVPVEELYRMCEIARGMLTGDHGVGRVIARPFAGEPGNFWRTERRRDYSIAPPRKTLLDFAAGQDLDVIAVGKIEDIFSMRGITRSLHTTNNHDTLDAIARFLSKDWHGILFANCIDFDMLYGHRNDVPGFARALEEVDARIGDLAPRLRDSDVLVITADHGCDPTTPSTDHSREHVPLLIYGKPIRPGVSVGTRGTFADLGATIADMLGVNAAIDGTSCAHLFLRAARPGETELQSRAGVR